MHCGIRAVRRLCCREQSALSHRPCSHCGQMATFFGSCTRGQAPSSFSAHLPVLHQSNRSAVLLFGCFGLVQVVWLPPPPPRPVMICNSKMMYDHYVALPCYPRPPCTSSGNHRGLTQPYASCMTYFRCNFAEYSHECQVSAKLMLAKQPDLLCKGDPRRSEGQTHLQNVKQVWLTNLLLLRILAIMPNFRPPLPLKPTEFGPLGRVPLAGTLVLCCRTDCCLTLVADLGRGVGVPSILHRLFP